MSHDAANRLLIASIPPPPRIIGEIARPIGAPPILGCFVFVFFFGIFALIAGTMNVHREIEAKFHEVEETEGRITDVGTRHEVEINDRNPRIIYFEYVDPSTYETVGGSVDTLDFDRASEFQAALIDSTIADQPAPVTIEYVPGRPELATIKGMPRTLMAWWIGLFLLIPLFIAFNILRSRSRRTSRLRSLLERGQATTGEVTKVATLTGAGRTGTSAERRPGVRAITTISARFDHPINGQIEVSDRTADPEFGPESIKVGDRVTIVFDEVNATNATIPALHRVRF